MGCSKLPRVNLESLTVPLWLAHQAFHQDHRDPEPHLRDPCDEQSLDPTPGAGDRRSPTVGADWLVRSGGVLRGSEASPEPVAPFSLAPVGGPAPPGSQGSAPRQAGPSSIARLDLPVISVRTEASSILVSSRVLLSAINQPGAVSSQTAAKARSNPAVLVGNGQAQNWLASLPCWSKSAIHSASLISVFRPGTALIC
jgi:hypothetical protein